MAGSTAQPEGIPYVTGQDSPVPSVFTPIMAQRIHNRLALRQRYNFVWANSAERVAQTGMVAGSLGYQTDTKTDYIYTDNVWDLVTPHSEWTASNTFGDGNADHIGTMNASAGFTSSTSFVIATAAQSELQFVDRGIYSISMICKIENQGSVGATELIIRRSSGGILATGYIMNDRQSGSVALPNLYNNSDNNIIQFRVSKRTASNATVSSTVRVTRIG